MSLLREAVPEIVRGMGTSESGPQDTGSSPTHTATETHLSTLPEAIRPAEIGVPLPAYQQVLYERHQDDVKGTIPALNDFLQRMLTIDAAFIGGAFVAAAKGDVVPGWAAVITLTFLVLSLAGAVYGLCPRPAVIDPTDFRAIAEFDMGLVAAKSAGRTISAVALVIGLCVAVVGLTLKYVADALAQ
jgi:hypothetical protein